MTPGLLLVVYNLMTDYEWGLFKIIPMPAHLTLDVTSGVVLAISPWLFGFADHLWIPNLLMGEVQIGVAILTSIHPYEKSNTHNYKPHKL